MNQLVELITKLARVLVWWTTVNPWERSLRVRLGRHVRELPPGVHWKVPFVDTIYRQSTRERVSALQLQTLTTRDGRTLALSGSLGYHIADVRRLYDSLHHPEDSIRQLAMGAIAAYVQQQEAACCDPEQIAACAVARMHLERYGLGGIRIELTDFAFVRAHRLLMDQKWGSHGDSLQTSKGIDEPA